MTAAKRQGKFLRRWRRLYRYFRSEGIYRIHPRTRRNALWIAWGYAKKGADYVPR